MRVECPYCHGVLISNSRHKEHKQKPIIDKESNIFTSYAHCSNCGATSTINVAIKPTREPFKQDDLFPAMS